MITSQIGDRLSFWVTGTSSIRHILDAMGVYMDALTALGYASGSVYVGGGVHELDTGYESFGRKYRSFEEMKEHLCADFEAEEDELDGLWMNTLNFESIGVELKKDGVTGRLSCSRGLIRLECGADEAEIEKQCRTAIAPYLYRK